jgi:hypothetical protein
MRFSEFLLISLHQIFQDFRVRAISAVHIVIRMLLKFKSTKVEIHHQLYEYKPITQ